MKKTTLTSALAISTIICAYEAYAMDDERLDSNAKSSWWSLGSSNNGGVDENAKHMLHDAFVERKKQLDPNYKINKTFEDMGGNNLMTQSVIVSKEYREIELKLWNATTIQELKDLKLEAKKILIAHAEKKLEAQKIAKEIEEQKKQAATTQTTSGGLLSWLFGSSKSSSSTKTEEKKEETVAAATAPAIDTQKEEKDPDTSDTHVVPLFETVPDQQTETETPTTAKPVEQPKVEATAAPEAKKSGGFYSWFFGSSKTEETPKVEAKPAEETPAPSLGSEPTEINTLQELVTASEESKDQPSTVATTEVSKETLSVDEDIKKKPEEVTESSKAVQGTTITSEKPEGLTKKQKKNKKKSQKKKDNKKKKQ